MFAPPSTNDNSTIYDFKDFKPTLPLILIEKALGFIAVWTPGYPAYIAAVKICFPPL